MELPSHRLPSRAERKSSMVAAGTTSRTAEADFNDCCNTRCSACKRRASVPFGLQKIARIRTSRLDADILFARYVRTWHKSQPASMLSVTDSDCHTRCTASEEAARPARAAPSPFDGSAVISVFISPNTIHRTVFIVGQSSLKVLKVE